MESAPDDFPTARSARLKPASPVCWWKGRNDAGHLPADAEQSRRGMQPEDFARAGDERQRGEIQGALEEPRSRLLVMETYGASGRVLRYAHNFGKCYGVPMAALRCSPSSCCAARRRSANCAPTANGSTASTTSRRSRAYLEELATRERPARWCSGCPQPANANTAGAPVVRRG